MAAGAVRTNDGATLLQTSVAAREEVGSAGDIMGYFRFRPQLPRGASKLGG